MYYTEYAIPADVLTHALTPHVPNGATVTLAIAPEDMDIEGNASAWGDDEDAAYAADIRAQLDRGNDWAWCVVRITVTDGDAEGTSYLGGVSYWWTDATPNDAAIVRAFMADSGRDMLADALAEYNAECARLAGKYAGRA
jgi:hypothetical protein